MIYFNILKKYQLYYIVLYYIIVYLLQYTGVPLGKRGLTYFGGACALRFLNFNFWEPVRSRFQDLTSNF